MGIFTGLFKSRDKPQNRTSGSNYAFFFGGTTSGKAVTERSAMQMTAVYSCVRILSEAVAGLPLHLYKYTDNGGKAMALDHPLYHLLHDEPNPEISSFVFRETLMTHLLLWGNAYAQIIRNGKGEVVALYPLMPNRIEVNRDKNGKLYYERERRKSLAQAYSASDIFASRIFCGECGHLYGCKVWNSNNKYRRVVWRCNAKYSKRQGSAACHTPHLTEEQVKKAFVGAFNSCIKNKSEIIAGCREAIALVCDTAGLEERAASYNEECEISAELIRKCIEKNAHVSIKPEVYRERYDSFAERYVTVE